MIVVCSHCGRQLAAKVVGEYVVDPDGLLANLDQIPGWDVDWLGALGASSGLYVKVSDEVGFTIPTLFRLLVGTCVQCAATTWEEGAQTVINLNLVKQDLGQKPLGKEPEEHDWDSPEIVWSPRSMHTIAEAVDAEIMSPIPGGVRSSLKEAKKNLESGSYNSCAVMCRRAIETSCHTNECHTGSLFEKLKELCEKGIIDSKVLDWAREIQWLGNIGGHDAVRGASRSVTNDEARFALEFAEEFAKYVFVLNERYERFKRRNDAAPESEEDN